MNPLNILSHQLHIISFKRALSAIILFTLLWIFIFWILVYSNLDNSYSISSAKFVSGVIDLILKTSKFQVLVFITPIICIVIVEVIYQLIQFKWGRKRFTLLENIIGISFIPGFLLIFALPIQFVAHRYFDPTSSIYSMTVSPVDKFAQISFILLFISIFVYLLFRSAMIGSFALLDKYSASRKVLKQDSEFPEAEVIDNATP